MANTALNARMIQQNVTGTLNAIKANPADAQKLKQNGVDLGQISGMFQNPPPPDSQAQYAGGVLALPLAPVASVALLGFLIAAVFLLWVLAYLMDNPHVLQQILARVKELIDQVTVAKERVKKYPKEPGWRPECLSALRRVVAAAEKIVARYNSSPVGRGLAPNQQFIKGIYAILNTDFVPALRDLMLCMGYGPSSAEFKYLFNNSTGVMWKIQTYLARVLTKLGLK